MPKLPTDEDRFRKLVWHGKLPIQISLAKEDRAALLGRASPSSPPVYYVMAHRCSYLSLITDDVKAWLEALERAAPDRPSFIKPTQVWYAFNGAPLKWHYPIGLLYDLHSIRHPPGTVSAKPICTTKLPWTITVHLTNFPADRLLRNPSRDTTHHYFMAQYKEAEFMRTGSTKRVMNLPREDQDRLWAGLTTAEFETFWAVNHGAVNADDKDDLPRHVAIRLYSRTDSAVVQVPLPLAELGSRTTVGEAIAYALRPEQFATGHPPKFRPEDESDQDAPYMVVLHGIVVSSTTPLLWLTRNLCYPDNFLHVVLL